MKLAFSNAQVLLVRRERLGTNPARNVKFLGNLQGPPSDWQDELAAAQERARQAGLVLVLARRYDELHLTRPGGLDSNHCLHLFNHFRPAEKKMINKWETYMPIALHRTYERLVRQPLHMSAGPLAALQFDGLFDKLREREIQPTSISAAEEKTQRSLLLVVECDPVPAWLCAFGPPALAVGSLLSATPSRAPSLWLLLLLAGSVSTLPPNVQEEMLHPLLLFLFC